jgi:hypothetical protein
VTPGCGRQSATQRAPSKHGAGVVFGVVLSAADANVLLAPRIPQWAPQFCGGHAQQDTATKSSDWINTKIGADPSRGGSAGAREKGARERSETRRYLRWESPVLGINSRGKVAPFVAGCQVIFTQIRPGGKATLHDRVFTSGVGCSGLTQAPIQPHTLPQGAPSCVDRRAIRRALGLDSGFDETMANGVDRVRRKPIVGNPSTARVGGRLPISVGR